MKIDQITMKKPLELRETYSKKNPSTRPMNNFINLNVNTIYGDIVSPYFQIGNTFVGKNITARTRSMVWYMEKGLNGFQTITDSVTFNINKVVKPRRKKLYTSNFHDIETGRQKRTLSNRDRVIIQTQNNHIERLLIRKNNQNVNKLCIAVIRAMADRLRYLILTPS
uniref:Uncharacterized protein n=1 Tax=Liagoropsis maxima TaxID=1653392 RepID=A0A1G4NW13_9FLOR|nr:Hypothetical protein ORF_13 [Liagoropsis maxima]SCW22706.1 Hypothetical protein ORF_13 [Liagoropsis maxima]